MKLLMKPTKSKTKESKGFVFVNSACCCCRISVNIPDINEIITNNKTAIIPHIANQIKTFAVNCRQDRLFGSSKILLRDFAALACSNGIGH